MEVAVRVRTRVRARAARAGTSLPTGWRLTSKADSLPQEAHLRSLGAALCAAITRDFAPEQRRVGALPRLLPEHVHEMARAQLELLGAYQHHLDAALARANLQGEAARGEEQLRLFAGP